MSDTIETKTCTKCKVEKPATDFSTNNWNPDGKQIRCISCMSAYTREYRARKVAEMKAKYAAY